MVPRKYLPPVVRPYKVALTLACMELASGIALSLLALWLLMWAPNADPRHNPYWSGLTLALSGGLSPLMLSCCRKEYPGSNEYCVAAFKIICILASALATVLCFVACLYAVLHLNSLSDMTCEPGNLMNTTCMCRPSGELIAPETRAEARTQFKTLDLNKDKLLIQNVTESHTRNDMTVYWYYYKDLNCQDVQGPWTALMYVSATLNGVGVVVCSVFLYLFWASRKEYKYAKVKTRDNQNIVIHQADS
ncbi:uncharacterized protein LOC113383510 [Ctenocephalides felis]|uniref:uncharacterized protein LOC113383510 n=1 Tax=Ctenocephalides felis TaxID=7515 RepID=UPI000E6E411D|nr:uncharacterized protein LOC113383510 [Ctenocephalides felis]